jgi:Na+/H+ antiporter NhaD/arsenite permease-like protein
VRESQWNPRSLRWNVIVPWVLIAVAVLTVITGRLPGEDLVGLAETTGPVLVFVIAMTIVAELASVAGVFSVVAERLAVWGRGRRALLWLFVLAMVTVSTAFMSLDTTAVLITPVIVVLARHVGLSPLPFALATVWLANTASLFLPVSNLTNLLAADALGGTPLEFFAEFWAPALVAVLITVLALTLIHRRRPEGPIRTRGDHGDSRPTPAGHCGSGRRRAAADAGDRDPGGPRRRCRGPRAARGLRRPPTQRSHPPARSVADDRDRGEPVRHRRGDPRPGL